MLVISTLSGGPKFAQLTLAVLEPSVDVGFNLHRNQAQRSSKSGWIDSYVWKFPTNNLGQNILQPRVKSFDPHFVFAELGPGAFRTEEDPLIEMSVS